MTSIHNLVRALAFLVNIAVLPLSLAGFWLGVWDKSIEMQTFDRTKTIGLQALCLMIWLVALIIYNRHFA